MRGGPTQSDAFGARAQVDGARRFVYVPDVGSSLRRVEWILRLAAAGVFAGHGAFALGVKESWIAFFAVVGLGEGAARAWMPWVGVLDLALAALVLVRPTRAPLLWMVAWAFWTAALRPLSGGSILELVERAGNFGAPLALLALYGWPARPREWLARATLR